MPAFNTLKAKSVWFNIKTQCVPRSKHLLFLSIFF